MKLISETVVTPVTYTEKKFEFITEEYGNLEYSVRLYEDGSHTFHDWSGRKLFISTDEFSDDLHDINVELTDKISEFLNLTD